LDRLPKIIGETQSTKERRLAFGHALCDLQKVAIARMAFRIAEAHEVSMGRSWPPIISQNAFPLFFMDR
jgi:hypothetical protein